MIEPDPFVGTLKAHPDYEGQVVVHHRAPPRPPAFADLARPLPEVVRRTLDRAGIERFYTHQAEAIDLLRDGTSTVVATGTASGKSLCYHVPLLEAVAEGGVGLYLAPTRALGTDQLRQLGRFAMDGLVADTYDSDTPTHVRASIRAHATFVLTNPDMLHVGILPNHHRWARFLRRLRIVVVDEAHTLRGIFGSHVALVLRRLRRLAARYGSDPVFALASATIGNPSEHASDLVGLPVRAVTEDGAPTGERHTVFWNPPVGEDGRRASSNAETAALLEALVVNGARTLAFSRSRLNAELVSRYTRDRLPDEMAEAVAAYRAGYLAEERRIVEQGLADGTLLGVSATNALELGIDIGHLDAVLLNGFPGTVASARQRSG
ncbi:MAG TPA: DEAD/DEAH box helicase, partial [Actinomycetota bacterium]|nr:DEAD/DEAH box helicase [Actinomycetota bacterium]